MKTLYRIPPLIPAFRVTLIAFPRHKQGLGTRLNNYPEKTVQYAKNLLTYIIFARYNVSRENFGPSDQCCLQLDSKHVKKSFKPRDQMLSVFNWSGSIFSKLTRDILTPSERANKCRAYYIVLESCVYRSFKTVTIFFHDSPGCCT